MSKWQMKSGFLSTSMILLVLLASLPEAFCSCDISWGPVGLTGNTRLCQTLPCQTNLRQPDSEVHGSCCCCSPSNREPSSHHLVSHDPTCGCSFFLVNPAPIAVSQSFDGDTSLQASLSILTTLDATPRLVASTSMLVVHSYPRVLTPPDRCALLQTWRA